MLETVLVRVHNKEPSKSYQRIHDFKNAVEINEYVEFLSRREDVVNVEVVPFNCPDMSYNDYLKKMF